MYTKLRRFSTNEIQQEKNWIEQVYPGLKQYCQFLSKNIWDGDDLAQEAILKAVQMYGHRPNDITPALVNKIAYHSWIDVVRKRKHETIEPDVGINEEELPHTSTQIERRMDMVELLCNHLTPKQAVIFLLKNAFQFQAKEIAEIMNTSEVGVKSVLSRIKKRLEKGIQNEAFPNESFWSEDDQEILSDLFNQALLVQDPTVLIKAIPSVPALKSESIIPMLVNKHSKNPHSTHSPSSYLSMAA